MKLLFLTVAFMTFPSLTLAQDSNELPFVSPAEVGMSAEKLAKVDAAMDELVNQKQIPGGIATGILTAESVNTVGAEWPVRITGFRPKMISASSRSSRFCLTRF